MTRLVVRPARMERRARRGGDDRPHRPEDGQREYSVSATNRHLPASGWGGARIPCPCHHLRRYHHLRPLCAQLPRPTTRWLSAIPARQ